MTYSLNFIQNPSPPFFATFYNDKAKSQLTLFTKITQKGGGWV